MGNSLPPGLEPHPYFDLLLHTRPALEGFLGSQIWERITLHEWPLSCVQRLLLADGRRLIYKSQREPTVEPEFINTAASPWLPQAQILYRTARDALMLLEFLDAPRLCDLPWQEPEAQAAGQNLLNGIAQMDARRDLPVYLDLSDWEHWQMYMQATLHHLLTLSEESLLPGVTQATLAAIQHAASSTPVRQVIAQPAGLVHGDLSAENVFQTAQGFRIIDWQRPLRGPSALDLAALAESLHFDATHWVEPAVITVRKLLSIGWFAACAAQWFPAGRSTYGPQIAQLAQTL